MCGSDNHQATHTHPGNDPKHISPETVTQCACPAHSAQQLTVSREAHHTDTVSPSVAVAVSRLCDSVSLLAAVWRKGRVLSSCCAALAPRVARCICHCHCSITWQHHSAVCWVCCRSVPTSTQLAPGRPFVLLLSQSAVRCCCWLRFVVPSPATQQHAHVRLWSVELELPGLQCGPQAQQTWWWRPRQRETEVSTTPPPSVVCCPAICGTDVCCGTLSQQSTAWHTPAGLQTLQKLGAADGVSRSCRQQ